MRKYLLGLLLTFLIVTPTYAYTYTVRKGDTLWGLFGAKWTQIAADNGITNPRKLQVGQKIEVKEKEGVFGASIPSTPALIDTYLAAGISKTDTTMILANGADRDGNPLSGFMCFTIDANTPSVEYVCGTASGTVVTGLMRGLSVTNPNSTSTDRAFVHRRLASVQNTDYPILQILSRVLRGQDSTGSGTFIIGDDTNAIKFENTTTSNKYIYAWGNTGNPFLRYNGSNWQFSDNGVDTVNLVTGGSGLSASTTAGIGITDSQIYVNVSSTTGMSFDSSGKLYQKVNSSLTQDSNGIGVSTTSLVNGGVATTTPTAGMIPITNANGYLHSGFIDYTGATFGDGSDGDVVLSVSTTLTRDMYYRNLTVDSDVVLNAGGYRIFVQDTLINNGTISRDGNNGANGGNGSNGAAGGGGVGGSALASGTIFGGLSGGVGGNGDNNSGACPSSPPNADSLNPSMTGVNGVSGGTGGKYNSGYCSYYSTPGTATLENSVFALGYNVPLTLNTTTNINLLPYIVNGQSSLSLLSTSAASAGGAGGSASGGGWSGGGGGAGGNGGIVYISALNIINNGTISVKGGNGGNGGIPYCGNGESGGSGGGGGGNGGLIILIYRNFTDNGTLNVNGGSGGLGSTHCGQTGINGTNGSNGNSGKYIKIKI